MLEWVQWVPQHGHSSVCPWACVCPWVLLCCALWFCKGRKALSVPLHQLITALSIISLHLVKGWKELLSIFIAWHCRHTCWEPLMPHAHSTPIPVLLSWPLFLSYFTVVLSPSAALSLLIPSPVLLVWDAHSWLAAFPESDYCCFCKNYHISGLASSNDWNRATHTPLNQADTKIIIFVLYLQCLSVSLLWTEMK